MQNLSSRKFIQKGMHSDVKTEESAFAEKTIQDLLRSIFWSFNLKYIDLLRI